MSLLRWFRLRRWRRAGYVRGVVTSVIDAGSVIEWKV